MAYTKKNIRVTKVDQLERYLDAWADEIPWMECTSQYDKDPTDRSILWFSATGSEPSGLMFDTDSAYIARFKDDGRISLCAKYGHSTVGTDDYDINRAGPSGDDFYNEFYYNNTGVLFKTDYSAHWIDAAYITDNFIAFTIDHANSAVDQSLKNIMFVIAKTNHGDVAYIFDSALASGYDNVESHDVIAINYDTEILCTVPTLDNNYSKGDRLANSTILSPICCNDNKNRMVLDVYAVSSKQHESFCDILTIDNHHYLTNGKIACKLD